MSRPAWTKEVLFTEAQIQQRIGEVAQQIANDYRSKVSPSNPLLLVCVLRGAFVFMADLARALSDRNIPVQCDFIMVASYVGTSSTGEVKMLLDVRAKSVADRHVLMVEDICDTARTLDHLLKHFRSRNCSSVKMVTLLDKKPAREIPLDVDYVCYDIPKKFVVGYGLDYNQSLRELRDIVVFDEPIYQRELEASKRKSKL